jgi:lactoylglutathione lyase
MTTSTSTSTDTETTAGLSALKPRISHVAYHVSDIERSLAFYIGALGLKEQLRLPLGKGLHEVVLGYPDNKGAGLILMWNTEKTTAYQLGEGYSRFVVSVSDVDAALRFLVEKDVKVVQNATQAGNLKYAMVKDPDGYVVELLQLIRS